MRTIVASRTEKRFSLYLIDGERVTPRSLRVAVAELDKRFVAEDPRDLTLYNYERDSAWPEGDEAWLWLADDDGTEIGFASFSGTSLYRVWIDPEYRRTGLLTAAWDAWSDRYGEFDVQQPDGRG
jgi:hypothetical protein